jgi:acyl-[acyl-carrier-protein]-phospholipid O-acyltransferase / long-chain-fatty-acid--[acyl-carrier-protein] ligase
VVPWAGLGIALFSIALWLASPDAGPFTQPLLTVGQFLAMPRNWFIFIALFGIAVSGGVFALPLYALLQTAGDEHRRARAIGANNVVNAAAMVLSALVVIALVAAGFSVPMLFLLTGVLTLTVTGVFWRWRGGLVASAVPIPAQAE